MKRIAAVGVFFLLAGCAGPAATLVNADLDGAIALAQGAGDAEAVACYQAMQKANTSSVVGMFGLIEQVRIFRQSRGLCVNVLLP